jgi:hypothetical protein
MSNTECPSRSQRPRRGRSRRRRRRGAGPGIAARAGRRGCRLPSRPLPGSHSRRNRDETRSLRATEQEATERTEIPLRFLCFLLFQCGSGAFAWRGAPRREGWRQWGHRIRVRSRPEYPRQRRSRFSDQAAAGVTCEPPCPFPSGRNCQRAWQTSCGPMRYAVAIPPTQTLCPQRVPPHRVPLSPQSPRAAWRCLAAAVPPSKTPDSPRTATVGRN